MLLCVFFCLFFLNHTLSLPYHTPPPKQFLSWSGDQQTGPPCEPSGPACAAAGLCVPLGCGSWATPCCCWSRACFACCRCCGPRCCSQRRAGTSGRAVCRLSHLDAEQEWRGSREGIGPEGGRKNCFKWQKGRVRQIYFG